MANDEYRIFLSVWRIRMIIIIIVYRQEVIKALFCTKIKIAKQCNQLLCIEKENSWINAHKKSHRAIKLLNFNRNINKHSVKKVSKNYVRSTKIETAFCRWILDSKVHVMYMTVFESGSSHHYRIVEILKK